MDPLEPIGRIEAIVNSEFVLIRAEDNISFVEGEEVVVYGVLEDAKLQERGLHPIKIPKGRLVISSRQSEAIYLASTTTTKNMITTKTQERLSAGLGRLLGIEEVQKEVPRIARADVNDDQSLKLSFSKEVSLGDLVARAP